jgi:hypothetical protein
MCSAHVAFALALALIAVLARAHRFLPLVDGPEHLAAIERFSLRDLCARAQ